MAVSYKLGAKYVRVWSPYHERFIAAAKQLGGTFDRSDRAWVFAAEDVDRVRALLVTYYQTDGTEGAPLVKVRVKLGYWTPDRQLILGGRTVLDKMNRDSAPRLGEQCVVIEGRLKSSGGSRNNPCITFEEATVVEMRAVPLAVAERIANCYAEESCIEIVLPPSAMEWVEAPVSEDAATEDAGDSA